jgi:hypothetical protein
MQPRKCRVCAAHAPHNLVLVVLAPVDIGPARLRNNTPVACATAAPARDSAASQTYQPSAVHNTRWLHLIQLTAAHTKRARPGSQFTAHRRAAERHITGEASPSPATVLAILEPTARRHYRVPQ